MATNWGKVKYIARVRPDSDDGMIDECNDSLDECEVQVKINDVLRDTDHDGLNTRSLGLQPNLKRAQHDSLCLSVPQDLGRRTNNPYEQVKSGEAERTALRKRSHSANFASFSVHGSEVNGDIPLRSQSLLKIVNRRVLVKDMFMKQEEADTYDMKVRHSALNHMRKIC